MSVSVQPTTSTHCGPRQKPGSQNPPWGRISAQASTRTARLSPAVEGDRFIGYLRERSLLPLHSQHPARRQACIIDEVLAAATLSQRSGYPPPG
ncbi:hypothetical protein VZT92_005118 [Zoarces viviparus]|uniref:Uncharacterized protein n=1 Tax=Zoarces viviparus TaxID=48416 RepID=A0AAW1FSG6_ZOAVI